MFLSLAKSSADHLRSILALLKGPRTKSGKLGKFLVREKTAPSRWNRSHSKRVDSWLPVLPPNAGLEKTPPTGLAALVCSALGPFHSKNESPALAGRIENIRNVMKR